MKEGTFSSGFTNNGAALPVGFTNLSNVDYFRPVIEALPEVVAVLNAERQIVFSNEALLKFLGITNEMELIGLQHGQAFKCANAFITKEGCGTSEKCHYCGMFNAVLESRDTLQKVTKECRITTVLNGKPEFLDLNVTSSPLKFQGNYYSILSIQKVCEVRRNNMLDCIFFHDAINIAGGLKGITEILAASSTDEQTKEYIDLVNKMSIELLEEIMSQRAIAVAENYGLVADFAKNNISSVHILKEIRSYFSYQPISKNKKILIEDKDSTILISTDEVLLKRVLINMLKNALEASPNGATVSLTCKAENGFVKFAVHNRGFIPLNIQTKIFQWSFSTKEAGRGLGTYSIKLLTEKYLNGTTGFTTSEENGTVFFVRIPCE
jgi:nitrogen-specific signal transduction histidine kinase